MKPDEERRDRNSRRIALTAAVAVLLIWVVWWQWDAIRDRIGRTDPTQERPGDPTVAETAGTEEGASTLERGPAESAWVELLGSEPVWPGDPFEPRDCEAIADDRRRLCEGLDRSIAAGGVPLTADACATFDEVASRLMERPPPVASELGSHERMLGNLFHLSRTVGRERLRALARAVRAEPSALEPAMMVLHEWVVSRAECAEPADRLGGPEARYEYAAYLFRTLGGQAFLRRRAPAEEGLLSFYALVTLDRSRQVRHDPHGVDPRPEIARTRALLADSPFLFRDEYLRILDVMAARSPNR